LPPPLSALAAEPVELDDAERAWPPDDVVEDDVVEPERLTLVAASDMTTAAVKQVFVCVLFLSWFF